MKEKKSAVNERGGFIRRLSPPPEWRTPVLILLGIFTGLGLSTFYISNAVSYLSDDPAACINCHVMVPEYSTWERSSHGQKTNCNDCHVPQDNIFSKFYFKAQDGLRHSFMFTFRMEPQVIRIKEAGKNVVQENCIRCHQNYIHPLSLRAINNKTIHYDDETRCWDCHRETPHGRVHSLASTPNARIEDKTARVPDWIKKELKKN